MTKQKSKFWTFIFSLIPGAGEMYMGFKKQGISVMGIFWLVIAIAQILGLGTILFTLPLIWFYSFFHVHNLSSLPPEEFHLVEDNYLLFDMDFLLRDKEVLVKKYRNIIAGVLILIGCSILWNSLFTILYDIVPAFLERVVYEIGRYVPKVVIALIIIYMGISLVRGKKKELDYNENA